MRKKSGAIYFSKNDSLLSYKSLLLPLCCSPRGPIVSENNEEGQVLSEFHAEMEKQRFRKCGFHTRKVSQVKVKRRVKLRSFISQSFLLYHSSSLKVLNFWLSHLLKKTWTYIKPMKFLLPDKTEICQGIRWDKHFYYYLLTGLLSLFSYLQDWLGERFCLFC